MSIRGAAQISTLLSILQAAHPEPHCALERSSSGSRSSRPTLHRRVPCEAMLQRLDTSILGLRLAAEPEREVRATRTLSRSIGPTPNWRIRTLVAIPRSPMFSSSTTHPNEDSPAPPITISHGLQT